MLLISTPNCHVLSDARNISVAGPALPMWRRPKASELVETPTPTTQQVTLTQSNTTRTEKFLAVIEQFTISLKPRIGLLMSLFQEDSASLQKLYELPPHIDIDSKIKSC